MAVEQIWCKIRVNVAQQDSGVGACTRSSGGSENGLPTLSFMGVVALLPGTVAIEGASPGSLVHVAFILSVVGFAVAVRNARR